MFYVFHKMNYVYVHIRNLDDQSSMRMILDTLHLFLQLCKKI